MSARNRPICAGSTYWKLALGLSAALLGCSSARSASVMPPARADAGQSSTAEPRDDAAVFVDAGSTPTSCITARAEATLAPLNLVFMFDQSGSMGDPVFAHASAAARWDPITSGLEAFFGDVASTGISASLQFFPAESDSRLWAPSCSVADYRNPEVSLTPLPGAAPFAASIARHSPLGGTPTLPAVTGALLYAKSLDAQYPNAHAAVVLVTDGEPSNCGTLDEVTARLTAEASTIKTYVVGVGQDLTVLNRLAAAGGTGSAILVDVTTPQAATSDFMKALAAIRGRAVSCSIPIPAAPEGKTLEPNRVNVALTSPGQAAEVLDYQPDCQDPAGWHYDDVTAPKTIELCAASCDRARLATAGAVEVQLGCATKGLK